MAGWVANFLSSNDSQPKDTESENQATNSTGGGGIASFISGLLWSGADTDTDSSSHESLQDSNQKSAFQEPNDKLDKSWEDVDMADLKPKVNY